PQSRNELATSKPLPIVQPTGPIAPSIGLANESTSSSNASLDVDSLAYLSRTYVP
ncbi:MAG: hypothetical protein EZS28_039115, partial [Streblomastix strix]